MVVTCGGCRDGGSYFSKVTYYLLHITSNKVTYFSYIIITLKFEVTSNILHITFYNDLI